MPDRFLRWIAYVVLLPLAEGLAVTSASRGLMFAVNDAFNAVAKATSPLTNSVHAIVSPCVGL